MSHDLTNHSLKRAARPGGVSAGDDSGIWRAVHTAATVEGDWRRGAAPNLTVILADNPELKNHRTVVLEMAYEEYRLRRQAGEAIDPEEYSRHFPSLERSLYFYIAVHSLLGSDPDFLSLQAAIDWPKPGSRFLGFDLLREIGRGAAGRVYLASECALGRRHVVLKVALHGSQEAEILGRLRHAGIVPIHSIQEDPATGLTAFCMPCMGQATLSCLADAVAGGHLPARARAILDVIRSANEGVDVPESPPPDRVLRNGSYVEGVIHLAAQLAEALAHSHARGILHRDLKPNNVLLAPEGRALLLDFNLSVDDRQPVWKVGGTLPYMPPEALAPLCEAAGGGDRRPQCDPRSDLFSLGVIVYELLSGVLPFGAMPCDGSVEEIAARLRKRQAEGPLPLRELNPRVDQPLAELVERCLAFDPAQRPRTADGLAGALRRELTFPRRARRWAAVHRRMMLAVASVATLLVIGAAAYFATRPPYAIRQYRQAIAWREAGRDDLALQCLNASLVAQPDLGEAFIARAQVYQRLGQFQAAMADYDAANRLAPSPALDACEGYCANRLAENSAATAFYRRALEHGEESPAVLNNLGYSWLCLGRLDEAEACLRRAIVADDGLQAAHYNMVSLFVQRACEGKPVPAEAFRHARHAVETGPESAELFRNLAFLYALATRQDTALAPQAIDFVAKAVAHGENAEIFRTDLAFAAVRQHPAFTKALTPRDTVKGPRKAIRVVDPTGEMRLAGP